MKIVLMKFISCIIAFAIGLDLFFEATLVDILSFSLLVTVVSYVLGDRIILPRVGKQNALVIDFFLTYVMVWIFGSVLLENYVQIAWGSLLAAFLITGAEVFVHRYLGKLYNLNERGMTPLNPKMAFGMEMGEEQNPRIKK